MNEIMSNASDKMPSRCRTISVKIKQILFSRNTCLRACRCKYANSLGTSNRYLRKLLNRVLSRFYTIHVSWATPHNSNQNIEPFTISDDVRAEVYISAHLSADCEEIAIQLKKEEACGPNVNRSTNGAFHGILVESTWGDPLHHKKCSKFKIISNQRWIVEKLLTVTVLYNSRDQILWQIVNKLMLCILI